MAKSLNDIYLRIQAEKLERARIEEARRLEERRQFDEKERRRLEYVNYIKTYEMAYSPNATSTSAAGAGGNRKISLTKYLYGISLSSNLPQQSSFSYSNLYLLDINNVDTNTFIDNIQPLSYNESVGLVTQNTDNGYLYQLNTNVGIQTPVFKKIDLEHGTYSYIPISYGPETSELTGRFDPYALVYNGMDQFIAFYHAYNDDHIYSISSSTGTFTEISQQYVDGFNSNIFSSGNDYFVFVNYLDSRNYIPYKFLYPIVSGNIGLTAYGFLSTTFSAPSSILDMGYIGVNPYSEIVTDGSIVGTNQFVFSAQIGNFSINDYIYLVDTSSPYSTFYYYGQIVDIQSGEGYTITINFLDNKGIPRSSTSANWELRSIGKSGTWIYPSSDGYLLRVDPVEGVYGTVSVIGALESTNQYNLPLKIFTYNYSLYGMDPITNSIYRISLDDASVTKIFHIDEYTNNSVICYNRDDKFYYVLQGITEIYGVTSSFLKLERLNIENGDTVEVIGRIESELTYYDPISITYFNTDDILSPSAPDQRGTGFIYLTQDRTNLNIIYNSQYSSIHFPYGDGITTSCMIWNNQLWVSAIFYIFRYDISQNIFTTEPTPISISNIPGSDNFKVNWIYSLTCFDDTVYAILNIEDLTINTNSNIVAEINMDTFEASFVRYGDDLNSIVVIKK